MGPGAEKVGTRRGESMATVGIGEIGRVIGGGEI